jgi:hypothetical protein
VPVLNSTIRTWCNAPRQDARPQGPALWRLQPAEHRAGSVNLFGFVDTTDTLGINTNINWSHRFSRIFFFTRLQIQPAADTDRPQL